MIKRIYIWILSLLKLIVSWYDSSIMNSAIDKVWGFFARKSGESLIGTGFRDKFATTRYFSRSVTAKIISLPFTLLKGFYNKNSVKIEAVKGKSSFISFCRSFMHVRVRQYGIILISFGLGALAVSLIKGGINLAVSMGAVIFGLLMLLNTATLNDTLASCTLISAVLKLSFLKPLSPSEQIYELKGMKLIICIAAAIGIISGLSNLALMLGFIACVMACVLIMYKTAAGIYIFVVLSPFLPTMALVAVIVITFISYVLHLALSTHASYKITPFTLIIAAFALIATFASVRGVNPRSSIMVLMVYMAFTLAFTLVVNNIKTKKQWCSLVALFALSAFIVAAYGVFQNFFITHTDQTWVDPNMFEDIKTRVYSTLDNPNVLGQFLIMAIPLTLACMMYSKNMPLRLTYAAFTAVGVACLFFTWSRAAWVGVMLAVVIMLLLKDKRFMAVCVIGLLLLPVLLPETMLARLTSIGNTKDTSTTYRIAVWTASVNMIRDFYLTGVGLGSEAFSQMYQNYALGGASFALHAHNFYLQWIADMGISGIVIYIMIILTAYKGIYKIGNSNRLMKLTACAIAGSLAGYLFQGIAETMWYTYRMILIFWIFMAFIQTANTWEGECIDD